MVIRGRPLRLDVLHIIRLVFDPPFREVSDDSL